jgi:hypothetical protein
MANKKSKSGISDILRSKRVIITAVLSVLLIGAAYVYADGRYRCDAKAEDRTCGRLANKAEAKEIEGKVKTAKAVSIERQDDIFLPIEIVGDNARGTSRFPDKDTSGYLYLAHRVNDAWQIIHKGQELPGKNIGDKYGLPYGWYSEAYESTEYGQ